MTAACTIVEELDLIDVRVHGHAHVGAANGVANGPDYGAGRVEYDVASALIIYEEYHPFGTSAYRAVDSTIEVSPKRYRYAAAERDEETGLDHMGLRYYAPWLGRWTSADPIGLGDGVNRYAYVRGNPVSMRDPGGTRAETQNPEAPTMEQLRAQHEQWRQEVEAEQSGKTPEPQPESPRAPDRQASKPYTGPDPRGAEWLESARAEYQDFLGRMYDTAKAVEQSVNEARDTALMWTGAYAASLFGPVAALRIGAALAGSQGAAYAFATSEAELITLAMEASPLFTAGVLTAEANVGSVPRKGSGQPPGTRPGSRERTSSAPERYPESLGAAAAKRTKQGGKFTEPNLPPRTVVDEGGVEMRHYTRSGDHGPAHLHVYGRGPDTKIGQRGIPIKGSPTPSADQQAAIDAHRAEIRKAIDQIQRWFRFENRY